MTGLITADHVIGDAGGPGDSAGVTDVRAMTDAQRFAAALAALGASPAKLRQFLDGYMPA